MPPLSVMLDDLPATRQQIARHLGISPATLTKYIKHDQAPRAVMLAMFWETKYGRSVADSEAATFAGLCQREANGLKDHVKRMTGIIWRLELELSRLHQVQPVAANLPLFRVM